MACLLACLEAPPAPAAARGRGAQPRVSGSCPEGFFRGFLDGAGEYMIYGRTCAAIPVDRLGRVQGDRTTCWESVTPPGERPAQAPQLSALIERDRSAGSWTLLSVSRGGRRVLTWRSYYPLLCAAGVYLSPDRRSIAVEIVRSRDYLPTGETVTEVVAFRLLRPLP